MEMRTAWYLKPGQTLENTRIEDRGKALLLTENAYGKITRHLDRNRLIQEARESEISRRQALKQAGEEMTRSWDNSVENIRIRKEEARIARIEKEKEEKMERFFQLRQEQAVIREKFIEDARKNLYISQGHPKNLTSALIFSEVLYEREKQLELDEKIRERQRQDEAMYAQKVFDAAQQEKKENAEKKGAMHKRSLELREIYLKGMHDKEENIRKERETRIEQEKKDIVNMERELEQIKLIEHEEDLKRRANVKKEFSDFAVKQQKLKEQMEIENKEQDLVIEIYSKAKHRIECLRKKKEQDMQKALQRKREAAAKQAVAEAKAKGEREERLIKEAQAEAERLELEKLKVKAAYREQLIKDKNEDRQAFLKRVEQEQFEENEAKKWLMLNRYKSDEYVKQYNEDKRNRLWQETLQYRKDLFDQMAENEDEREKERRQNKAIYKESMMKLAEEDKRFFDYAAEVLENAKSRGRRTSPIKRVIEEYKREHNLAKKIEKPCENYDVSDRGIRKNRNNAANKCSQHNPKV